MFHTLCALASIALITLATPILGQEAQALPSTDTYPVEEPADWSLNFWNTRGHGGVPQLMGETACKEAAKNIADEMWMDDVFCINVATGAMLVAR